MWYEGLANLKLCHTRADESSLFTAANLCLLHALHVLHDRANESNVAGQLRLLALIVLMHAAS
jgi:hypothetical protein